MKTANKEGNTSRYNRKAILTKESLSGGIHIDDEVASNITSDSKYSKRSNRSISSKHGANTKQSKALNALGKQMQAALMKNNHQNQENPTSTPAVSNVSKDNANTSIKGTALQDISNGNIRLQKSNSIFDTASKNIKKLSSNKSNSSMNSSRLNISAIESTATVATTTTSVVTTIGKSTSFTAPIATSAVQGNNNTTATNNNNGNKEMKISLAKYRNQTTDLKVNRFLYEFILYLHYFRCFLGICLCW